MTTAAWIYWIAGAALGGIGFYLASWALLSDWLADRRKQRRCAKCWYDMSATAGLKCPECGREAKSEKGLHRSRRRWGWFPISLLLVVLGSGGMFYGVARTIGWNQVLPLWLRVRLVDWLGQDVVLNDSYRLRNGTSFDRATADRLYRIAKPVLDGSVKGDTYGAELLVSVVGPYTSDPRGAALLLLDSALAAPPYSLPNSGKYAAQLLGPKEFLKEFITRVRDKPLDVSQTGVTGPEYWALTEAVPRLTEEQIPDYAYLVMRLGRQAHNFGVAAAPMSRFPDQFFEELRRVYEAGSADAKKKIMWFLASNTPLPLMDHPGMVWFAREACRLLDQPDLESRQLGGGLVHQYRRPGVLPVLPEVVALLGSTREATRRYARNTLANVQLEPDENAKFVAALGAGLRDGNDYARALILDILSVRAMLASPGVRAAMLDALAKSDDLAVTEKMLQVVVASDALRLFILRDASARSGLDDVRVAILALLDRGGVQTEAACRWLGRLPNPDPATRRRLHELLADKSRPRSDRAAARDALLHIRDRAAPETDPLSPLDLDAGHR